MPYEIHSIGTRTELRQTFDNVAHLYDEMRPSYPGEVFSDVIEISGVRPASRILEIGCGTGHATQVFAAQGLAIHGVELGAKMAAIARERLKPYPRVAIEVADFDVWTTAGRYDLVYSATAYHWLNPATREQRIAAVLDPEGWLAIWRNRHIRNGSCDEFLDEARVIYAEEAPELVKKRALLPGPNEVTETERDELTQQYFGEPVLRVYLWSRPYTAAEYVQMLNTHSDHQLLAADRRARLFERLAGLIDAKYGGSVRKDYATLLQMARRKS
ncbi:MAG: class I SAM-dependent methyltransferase [Acidobacteriota bacterium]